MKSVLCMCEYQRHICQPAHAQSGERPFLFAAPYIRLQNIQTSTWLLLFSRPVRAQRGLKPGRPVVSYGGSDCLVAGYF